MKIPKYVRSCLIKNMPRWAEKIDKVDSVSTLHYDIGDEKCSLGEYSSCVVGEFYGFKPQDTNRGGSYNGCLACYDHSMNIHTARKGKEFFEYIKDFCDHCIEKHKEIFKK